MQDFRNLEVWRKAHQLALAVYKTTAAYPQEERYGLSSQTRRAGTSVPANIAEGRGLGGDRNLARHLRIARGSAFESEYLLLLARDLGLIEAADHAAITSKIEEVRKMLTSLINRLAANG